MTKRLSNREKARLAVVALEAEIAACRAAGVTLPLIGRTLHVGLICKNLVVGRSTTRQNPAFQAVLEAYAAAEGFELPPSVATAASAAKASPAPASEDLVPVARLRQEQRRADAAERRIAELVARNAALLARLRRFEAADELLLSTGRRHRPPQAGVDLFAGTPHLPGDKYSR